MVCKLNQYVTCSASWQCVVWFPSQFQVKMVSTQTYGNTTCRMPDWNVSSVYDSIMFIYVMFLFFCFFIIIYFYFYIFIFYMQAAALTWRISRLEISPFRTFLETMRSLHTLSCIPQVHSYAYSRIQFRSMHWHGTKKTVQRTCSSGKWWGLLVYIVPTCWTYPSSTGGFLSAGQCLQNLNSQHLTNSFHLSEFLLDTEINWISGSW